MSDEEALQFYTEMEQFFGELPNFEHHPLQFTSRVKLFKYYKERIQNENSGSVGHPS